jgi:hypothetical protein
MEKELRKKIKDVMMAEFQDAVLSIYECASNYDIAGWEVTDKSPEDKLPLFMDDPDKPFNCLYAKWRMKRQSFYCRESLEEFGDVLSNYYQQHRPEEKLNVSYDQGRICSIAVALKKLRYPKERDLVAAWAYADFD